jgi:hypothetical protein
MTAKLANLNRVGGQFPAHCVKQDWPRQESSRERGAKWYLTNEGREELKEKLNIELWLRRRSRKELETLNALDALARVRDW